jgi:putative transcriptional regulator
MGEPAAIADEVEIDRTCVLVAAPANRTALAPPGERYTAFTGVLIDLMREGVPAGPALLDMDTLYRRAEQTQRTRNRPLPQLRARNGGERIPLVRNLAGDGVASETPAPAPRIPVPRPGDVFTPADELDYDQETGGPYGAIAVLAYDQRLGALGVRLGRPVQRPPGEVLNNVRLATAIGPSEVLEGGPVFGVVLMIAELKRGARPVPGARRLSGSLVTLPLNADPGQVAGSVRRAWVFVGYLGWRPGQLEAELAQRALIPSPEPLATWLDRQE